MWLKIKRIKDCFNKNFYFSINYNYLELIKIVLSLYESNKV